MSVNNTTNYIEEIWNFLKVQKMDSVTTRDLLLKFTFTERFDLPKKIVKSLKREGINFMHLMANEESSNLILIKIVQAFFEPTYRGGLEDEGSRLHFFMGLETEEKDKLRDFFEYLNKASNKQNPKE